METELLPERLKEIDLVDPADVHPHHRFVSRRLKLARIRDHTLIALRAGIVEDGDVDRLPLLLTDVNQRAGRQSRLFRAFLHELHAATLVRRFFHRVKTVGRFPSFRPPSGDECVSRPV